MRESFSVSDCGLITILSQLNRQKTRQSVRSFITIQKSRAKYLIHFLNNKQLHFTRPTILLSFQQN